jgi:hypothetical protein
MNEGFAVILLGLLSAVCVIALFVVTSALFRGLVDETKRIASESAGRAVLIGLVNAIFLTAISLGFDVLASNLGVPLLGVIPALAVVALVVGLIFGLAAMAELLGDRMALTTVGWRRTAGGASALTLACITPFIGWYALLPYLGLRGLGAFVIGLVAQARSRKVDPEESLAA